MYRNGYLAEGRKAFGWNTFEYLSGITPHKRARVRVPIGLSSSPPSALTGLKRPSGRSATKRRRGGYSGTGCRQKLVAVSVDQQGFKHPVTR